ncbi:hypothetical protein shim_00080 [Shimia sp. SK013]|nr:hypothetical protein shim_00080 [Shimia sp. SK013]
MQRFHPQRLDAQHVDAKPRVDIIELHPQQRPQPVGIIARPRQPDLNPLHGLIRAKHLQPHHPHAFALVPQPCAQRRQQPVNRGPDVVFQSNRIGQGHPDGKGCLHRRRADRFRRAAQRLIQPQHQSLAKPSRQRRAGLAGQIPNPPQTQPRQLRLCVAFKAQARHRQIRQHRMRLTGWRNLAHIGHATCHRRRRAAPRPMPPLDRARPRCRRLLIDVVPAAMRGSGLRGKPC